jgi:hypothetical protein
MGQICNIASYDLYRQMKIDCNFEKLKFLQKVDFWQSHVNNNIQTFKGNICKFVLKWISF